MMQSLGSVSVIVRSDQSQPIATKHERDALRSHTPWEMHTAALIWSRKPRRVVLMLATGTYARRHGAPGYRHRYLCPGHGARSLAGTGAGGTAHRCLCQYLYSGHKADRPALAHTSTRRVYFRRRDRRRVPTEFRPPQSNRERFGAPRRASSEHHSRAESRMIQNVCHGDQPDRVQNDSEHDRRGAENGTVCCGGGESVPVGCRTCGAVGVCSRVAWQGVASL